MYRKSYEIKCHGGEDRIRKVCDMKMDIFMFS